jgi:hypothetical protein
VKALRFALCGAALALACGGGGGGGGGPTQPAPGINFTSASGGSTLVLAEASGGSATTLRLDLRAQSASGLYGVAFDLVYPSELLSFVGVTPGTFLGGTTSLQFEETGAGHLVIGLSRLGPIAGVSGSGTLLTLEFSSRGSAGTGSMAFEKNTAFDSSAKAISGVTWGGGSVTVVP